MKIAFFCINSSFSRNTLRALQEQHELVAIVEASTAKNYETSKTLIRLIKKLRSYFYTPPSLQMFGEENSIPYYLLQGNDQSDLATFIKTVQPDIICSCLFNRLIKPEVFNIPGQGAINIHPALLPAYPGPNPLFWQYYFMDLEGGVTVHYIDAGEDSGDIIEQQKIAIRPGMAAEEYSKHIIQTGVPLLLKALHDLEKGIVNRRSQGSKTNFRARRIRKGEELIDWTGWPIERIWHLVRGFEKRYELLPRPKYLPGFYWKEIGSHENVSGQIISSPKIRLDSGGFYLALPQGKIRLNPGFSIRRFLRAIL